MYVYIHYYYVLSIMLLVSKVYLICFIEMCLFIQRKVGLLKYEHIDNCYAELYKLSFVGSVG